jgi:amidase
MDKGPESSSKIHFKPSDWRKLQANNQQQQQQAQQLQETMAEDWQKAAKAKADSVLALIPKEWRITDIPSAEEQRDVTGEFVRKYLDEKEIEITETDAVGVVEKITTGQWKAVEVARAFCHRAAIAHQLVNCLHEIFFDQAIAEAEKADKYFEEHKKPIGVLHGLPVSLKDQFHVKE